MDHESEEFCSWFILSKRDGLIFSKLCITNRNWCYKYDPNTVHQILGTYTLWHSFTLLNDVSKSNRIENKCWICLWGMLHENLRNIYCVYIYIYWICLSYIIWMYVYQCFFLSLAKTKNQSDTWFWDDHWKKKY